GPPASGRGAEPHAEVPPAEAANSPARPDPAQAAPTPSQTTAVVASEDAPSPRGSLADQEPSITASAPQPPAAPPPPGVPRRAGRAVGRHGQFDGGEPGDDARRSAASGERAACRQSHA